MRRRLEMRLVAAAFAAACQQAPPSAPAPTPPPVAAPLSLEALRADPEGYVRERYADEGLQSALTNDLSGQGFTCAPRGASTECSLAQAAFASCFDVWGVTIDADGSVDVAVNRRCMGATPPAQR